MARKIHLDENSYFNLDTATLFVDGQEVGKLLKGIPFRILEYLARNSPNFMTENQIRENCWNEEHIYSDSGSLSQHIGTVRAAIRDKNNKKQFKHILEKDGSYKCVHTIDSDSKAMGEDVQSDKTPLTKPYLTEDAVDDLFRDEDLLQKARQYEKRLIGQGLKTVIEALQKRKGISLGLDELVRACKGCHFDDLIGLALEKLGFCEVILDGNQYDAETQLMLRIAITHIEIEKYVRQISVFRERLLSEKDRDEQQFLKSEIQDLKSKEHEKKSNLTNYEKEIEALQQDGMSKGSMLSLSVYKRTNDFEE